jgi:hypothetical protein
VGIVGREEILWAGGGQVDSSGGVRGKALWGNFEAESNQIWKFVKRTIICFNLNCSVKW